MRLIRLAYLVTHCVRSAIFHLSTLVPHVLTLREYMPQMPTLVRANSDIIMMLLMVSAFNAILYVLYAHQLLVLIAQHAI